MFRKLCGCLLLMISLSALAAPKADLWPRWQAHDPASTATIDHGAWTALLSRYLRTDAHPFRFAYGTVSPDDRKKLRDYLRRLQATKISGFARAEQMAYWINLYNAATIKLILDHYPVKSITKINISPGLFSFGPWDKKLLEVEGEALSLNDIEHRILRPIFDDPRIHYAVNCASIGCPNLQPRAFESATLDAMLDAAAREFVNHPRGVSIDNGKLIVSSIYEWFASDFGGGDAAVIAHLRRYAEPPLAARLADISRIRDDRYDWALNDTR